MTHVCTVLSAARSTEQLGSGCLQSLRRDPIGSHDSFLSKGVLYAPGKRIGPPGFLPRCGTCPKDRILCSRVYRVGYGIFFVSADRGGKENTTAPKSFVWRHVGRPYGAVVSWPPPHFYALDVQLICARSVDGTVGEILSEALCLVSPRFVDFSEEFGTIAGLGKLILVDHICCSEACLCSHFRCTRGRIRSHTASESRKLGNDEFGVGNTRVCVYS